MRKVTLEYVEVVNETEQFMIFSTTFDKKDLGLELILNTALPLQVQDLRIRKTVERLEKLTRKDVSKMS